MFPVNSPVFRVLIGLLVITMTTTGASVNAPIQQCVSAGQCKCKTDQGLLIDLVQFNAEIHTASDGTGDTYKWQPCTEFICDPTTGSTSVACQTHLSLNYVIGLLNSESFGVDPQKGLYVTYSDISQSRKSRVYLTCDESATAPIFTAAGEVSTTFYEMTLKSNKFCEGGGGDGGDTSESQVGTILVSLFFAFLILYFIVGLLFNVFYRKRSGVEMVPNHTFWLALPGLIKDGFLFVFGRCFRRHGYQEKI